MYIKKTIFEECYLVLFWYNMSEYKYIDRLKVHILGFVKTAYIDTDAFPIH